MTENEIEKENERKLREFEGFLKAERKKGRVLCRKTYGALKKGLSKKTVGLKSQSKYSSGRKKNPMDYQGFFLIFVFIKKMAMLKVS